MLRLPAGEGLPAGLLCGRLSPMFVLLEGNIAAGKTTLGEHLLFVVHG